MKLYGTHVSPYARRIRVYLASVAIKEADVEFVTMDIFSSQGRAQLIKQNPALKVPYLLDQGQSIYDSGVIYRYLNHQLSLPGLSWDQENLLTLIDAANDSFVSLLMAQRSDLDINQDVLFFNIQNERVKTLLAQLDERVKQGQFTPWAYPGIALFCLLDWINFRGLYALNQFQHLTQFVKDSQNQPLIQETDPRN